MRRYGDVIRTLLMAFFIFLFLGFVCMIFYRTWQILTLGILLCVVGIFFLYVAIVIYKICK